jgi:hypothetical protein
MVTGRDVLQTEVLDHLDAAVQSAKSLRQDLLVYLIEMALTEARAAFYGPSKDGSKAPRSG